MSLKLVKIFILNIKEAVRIFDKSSMFVKKRVKLHCNRTPPLGILPDALDLFSFFLFFFLILVSQYIAFS